MHHIGKAEPRLRLLPVLHCTAKRNGFWNCNESTVFLKGCQINSSIFINKNQVYFKRLGFEGAFDQQNGSHKGDIRKTVLKRSKHLRCPTWKN